MAEGKNLTPDINLLVPQVQEHLLAEDVPIPKWRGHTEEDKRQFTSRVIKSLVGLRVELPPAQLRNLAEEVATRLLGLGVLDPLLREEGTEEIIVRRGHLLVEKRGHIEDRGQMGTEEYFLGLARRVAEFGDRHLGAATPYVLVDLPDGSRFTALIPPLSDGPHINIRVFPRTALTLADLVASGSISEAAKGFLEELAADSEGSVLISGPPGAGKTTLLNALSAHFPPTDQICVAETFAELRIQQPHVVRAVAQAEVEIPNRVAMRELVNVLYTRMRPDILIVGEVVRGEASEFIHAANLGIRAFTTIHGTSPLDALYRLETMALETRPGAEFRAVRERVARGIDLVIHVRRTGARRYLHQITAVRGMDRWFNYRLEPIYSSSAPQTATANGLIIRWEAIHSQKREAVYR